MRQLRRLALAASALLPLGCTQPETTLPGNVSEQTDGARTAALFARSCALCHIDGNGGAPVIGDAGAWRPRLAQGRDVLLKRTIEGYNSMPPLGYCMACERSDFVALIDLMTTGINEGQGDE